MLDRLQQEMRSQQSSLARRDAQIFPVLSREHIQLVSKYGRRMTVLPETVLFNQGERHTSVYVITAGNVEISRKTAIASRVIGIYGVGIFTGEEGTMAGRGATATVRTLTHCELIVIDEASLSTLLVSEPDLSEIMVRAFVLRRVSFLNDENGGVLLLGSRTSAKTLELRDFLMRNGHSTGYFDVGDHPETRELMKRFCVADEDLPAIINIDGSVLKRPNTSQLADAIGLSSDSLHGRSFDVVVIGAGPAGLAAAVYGASEGLRVAVVDAKAPGGQAGSSSRIENYFGFPTGISGRALSGRGLFQARKFGAEVAVPVSVSGIRLSPGALGYRIDFVDDGYIDAHAVIIATGARYRKPDVFDLGKFEGRGIYYSASFVEATFCRNAEVIVAGGGNSAGQAAIFLAGHAQKVRLIIRGKKLEASMSTYLIQRILAAKNIELNVETQIVALGGQHHLENVATVTRGKPAVVVPTSNVFLFLGADPNTEWVGDFVALDEDKFIVSGADVPADAWRGRDRQPHFLETSWPRVFVVGDVRSGSTKRVATAVGEGAAAIQALHAVRNSDDNQSS